MDADRRHVCDRLRGPAGDGQRRARTRPSPRSRPGRRASTTNTPPANGTYFYVLRSYFQSWLSANTAEVSAACRPDGERLPRLHGRIERRRDDGRRGRLRVAGGQRLRRRRRRRDGREHRHEHQPQLHGRGQGPPIGSGTSGSASRRRRRPSSGSRSARTSASTTTRERAGSASSCRGTAAQAGRRPSRQASPASATTTYTLGGAADTWGRTWTGRSSRTRASACA